MIPAIPLIDPLFAFDNFLLICGKVTRSTWVNVWTAFVNIALDYYFIVHLGLGISYASLATTIGMVFGSILLMLPFIRNKLELKFTKPKISISDLKMVIANGFPEFFQSIAGSLMAVVTNGLMLTIAGGSGVAAMSVISYIEMLLIPVIMGVISSIQPVISFNVGAKNHKQVNETFKKVCILSASIPVLALAIMLLFPDFLVSMFTNESDVKMIDIATTGLTIYAFSYLFNWFNILVGTFLSAFEKPKEAMTLMLLDSIVLPLICFVALAFSIGVNGMFLAQTTSAFFAFVIAIYMWKKISKA